MKLHTVFITHNRLELTKRAIESYLETVTVPFSFIVVDNHSTDGTYPWLVDQFENHWGNETAFLALEKNFYPGYATNAGWEKAPENATHLHRADNDFIFLPGWCEEVERRFRNQKIGQVGLRTLEEEGDFPNVGGNCVIRRELWDAGLRYVETPWPELPPGYSEDSYFSPAVEAMGWHWTRVRRPCIRSIETVDAEDPYYQRSWGARHLYGYTPPS